MIYKYLFTQLRIFKNGKLIMQADALEKGIEKKSSEISQLLEGAGVGVLSVIGVTSIGIIGITLIPGVIVFGGAYYLLKKLNHHNLNKYPSPHI